jgi:hypothetical protein
MRRPWGDGTPFLKPVHKSITKLVRFPSLLPITSGWINRSRVQPQRRTRTDRCLRRRLARLYYATGARSVLFFGSSGLILSASERIANNTDSDEKPETKAKATEVARVLGIIAL